LFPLFKNCIELVENSFDIKKKLKMFCNDIFWIFFNIHLNIIVATLALGSWPRQGLAKVQPQMKPKNHISCSRECRRVTEWTHTLPSGLSLWELESRWTLESLEGDCKGQNSLDSKNLYTIEKLLELRCLKWTCMTHLGT
jgi:hypothetical protein